MIYNYNVLKEQEEELVRKVKAFANSESDFLEITGIEDMPRCSLLLSAWKFYRMEDAVCKAIGSKIVSFIAATPINEVLRRVTVSREDDDIRENGYFLRLNYGSEYIESYPVQAPGGKLDGLEFILSKFLQFSISHDTEIDPEDPAGYLALENLERFLRSSLINVCHYLVMLGTLLESHMGVDFLRAVLKGREEESLSKYVIFRDQPGRLKSIADGHPFNRVYVHDVHAMAGVDKTSTFSVMADLINVLNDWLANDAALAITLDLFPYDRLSIQYLTDSMLFESEPRMISISAAISKQLKQCDTEGNRPSRITITKDGKEDITYECFHLPK